MHEYYTRLIRSVLAKTCLPPLARGYSIPVLRRENLIHLEQAPVSSLGAWNRNVEEARTKDPGYQSMPTGEEA
jgi:hypothetical protein